MDRPFKFQSPPDPAPPPRPRARLNISLQAKLILTIMSVVTIALGGCCWLFANQSRGQLTELMGQQARVIAYTVSIAAESSLKAANHKQLEQIGHDLLKTRNVLYVAFFDAKQKPISLANRYEAFSWSNVSPIDSTNSTLNLSEPRPSSSFGEHVDVLARVIDGAPPKPVRYKNHQPEPQSPPATVGYVVVGVSLERETAQAQWVSWIVVGIGVSVVLLSLPVAYAMVWGIFTPIRELVEATRKIAAGRLDVKVEIDRGDMIGELAGSFSEMVTQVRRQREDLASSNSKLADANEQLGQANRMLAEANRDLEEKVALRTGQLEAANKRLSSEIAEKEDFLRAVSHDLNAPLRNIDGMAGLLLHKHRAQFSEEIIHRLQRIQKNVEVESDLISELLELSRIKTRRQKIELVDVETMVHDLSGMFEQDLTSKNISLIVETPLPTLLAEKARIRQIFQNLIDNAIKYMGLQKIREIRLGCIVRPEESEFYIRDTGMGIDEEDVGKIFYIFRRGRGAASQNVPGKGVGLASVKSIIETYNGTIWVESSAGRGSNFHFTINGQFVGSVLRPEAPTAGPADRLAA